MTQDYKDIVRRFVEEAFNKGNLDVVDEVYAESHVTHDPGAPEAERTREDAKRFVGAYRSAFSDGRSTVDDAIVEGNTLAYRWSYRGTHDGDLLGITPTGKRVEIWGVSLVRFEDGKIAEQWNGWDMLGLMQQLGVAPQPTQV